MGQSPQAGSWTAVVWRQTVPLIPVPGGHRARDGNVSLATSNSHTTSKDRRQGAPRRTSTRADFRGCLCAPDVGCGSILLQKPFCIAQQKFSGLWVRHSENHVGGPHYLEPNSQATSVTRLSAHRRVITACSLLWRKTCCSAFGDFCNNIGHKQNYKNHSRLAASLPQPHDLHCSSLYRSKIARSNTRILP